MPQTIDNALYDAFGQRQVSTMYRQLNQYHVVMEVDPSFQQSPDGLENIYVKSKTGAQFRCQLSLISLRQTLHWQSTTRDSFPR